MTTQVKTAIAKMKAAGFDRKDFAVKAERKIRTFEGERFREFGDARISVYRSTEYIVERKQALADAGLGVVMFIDQNGRVFSASVSNKYEDEGKIREYKIDTSELEAPEVELDEDKDEL